MSFQLPFSNCEKCPLVNKNHGQGYNGNYETAKIIILGMLHGVEENIIRTIIRKLGFNDEKDCVFCNITSCKPPAGRTKPTSEEINCCKVNLDYLIENTKAKVIITLGDEATKVLSGRSGITKRRGIPITISDKIIIPSFHPSYIVRNMGRNLNYDDDTKTTLLTFLKKDVSLAFDITKNGIRTSLPNQKVEIIKGLTNVYRLLDYLLTRKSIVVDIETTGLECWSELIGISFCCEDNKSYYIPFINYENKEEYTVSFNLAETELLKNKMKWFFNNFKGWFIAHNAKFDFGWISYNWHIDVDKLKIYDTMINHYLDNEILPHGLKPITDILFEDMRGYNSGLLNYKKENHIKEETMVGVPTEIVGNYCGLDSIATHKLAGYLSNKLPEPLIKIYNEIYQPMIPNYIKSEATGIEFDIDYATKLSKVYENRIKKLEIEIFELAGKDFNVNSPQQLSTILFDDMKLPILRRSKETKAPSTDKEVLINLWSETGNEVCKKIITYRTLSKFKATYIDGAFAFLGPDKRLHYCFNLIGARTGRLSCSDYAIQTEPRKQEMRAMFKARDGWKLIQADYSQLELRIMADLAGEYKMKNAWKNGLDMHKQMAKLIFNIEKDEEVQKWQRFAGKTVIFSAGYGGGKNVITKIINKNLFEAMIDGLIEESVGIVGTEIGERGKIFFFREYEEIRKFVARERFKIRKELQAVSVFGRIRHLPTASGTLREKINTWDTDEGEIESAMREGISHIVQGPASDICQMAYNNLFKHINKNNINNWLPLFTQHDAIYMEVEDKGNNVEEAKNVLREIMLRPVHPFENAMLEVDIKVSDRWASIPEKTIEEIKLL
jgi:DNA polymerase-1